MNEQAIREVLEMIAEIGERANIEEGMKMIEDVLTAQEGEIQLENKELKNKINKLEKALYQTDHFVFFTEDGWSISHLVSCRPDMTGCSIHRAMMQQEWENVYREGKYKVWLNDKGFLQFEKQPTEEGGTAEGGE